MYTDHFIKADTVINHIKTLSLPPGDYILQESYAGFVCVISVATYEMAIKDILVDFENTESDYTYLVDEMDEYLMTTERNKDNLYIVIGNIIRYSVCIFIYNMWLE